MNMQKVACLYRVSTKTQLDENDIPMQRKACLSFINKNPYWKLDREYIEKGVSGYHKSEDQRDVLLQLKRDAENKEFDILTVFMFDRLGRREDETTFVVEWLVSMGIDVWSVKEGQQCFHSRADKLVNYIRYWQSGSESEKNSIRVAEKHKQLVLAGKFRGGPPPYGYNLSYSGEFNNKGYERKKLTINEEEGKVVSFIFSVCVNENMGSYRIAKYLNAKGILTKKGNTWTPQAVIGIIRNPIYKGDYVSGRVKSYRGIKRRENQNNLIHSAEIIQESIIVDEKTWVTANEMITNRNTRSKAKIKYKCDLLLYRFTYCGYCGTRLVPFTRTWQRSKERAVYTSYHYGCPRKVRQGKCQGQFSYGAKKVDNILIEEIQGYIGSINKIQLKNNIIEKYEKSIDILTRRIEKLDIELAKLNEAAVKCLVSEGSLACQKVSIDIVAKEKELSQFFEHKETMFNQIEKVKGLQNEQITYKLFDIKKLITKLVSSVYVYQDRIVIRLHLEPIRKTFYSL